MHRRAIVATVMLVGCSAPDAGPDAAPPTPEWTVSPEPIFVAGGDADDEPLFRINGAVRLDNGYLIANASAGEVRLYGDDGRLIRTIGEEGSGPGEFLALRLAGRTGGDSVVVADDANRRVAIICDGERVCDEWTLPAAGNPIGIVGDHVILGEVVPDMSTDRVSYDRHTFFKAERRGTALDTIFELDSTPRIARRIDGRLISTPVPFSRPASMALVPEGIALTDGANASILIVDTTGAVAADIQLPIEVIAVSREEFDAEIERRLGTMEGARRDAFAEFYGDMPRPEHRTPIQRILADRRGLIWVELEGAGAVQEWLVVDASGQVRARASTPADLLVTEIGEDYIVGLWRDEMEVEFVHAYRLERAN
jgi:hypothetical protein